MLAVLAPLLVAGSIAVVDATHNSIPGNVKSDGSNLNDAKVTAERVGDSEIICCFDKIFRLRINWK